MSEENYICQKKKMTMDSCSDRFLNAHRKIILFIKNRTWEKLQDIPQPLCMHDYLIHVIECHCYPRKNKDIRYTIPEFSKDPSSSYSGTMNDKLNSL